MYMGIGEKQLEILNTEENCKMVRSHIMGLFDTGEWDEEVIRRAGTLLSTLSLCAMLKMSDGDLSGLLWNEAADNILKRVIKRYPKIGDIIDACPAISGDEYYSEWCNIYDYVFIDDLEEMVNWDRYYEKCERMIIDRFKKWLPEEFFKEEGKECSYDVRFCPVVNVKVKVMNPESPTEKEKEMIIEEAVKQVREQIEEKINGENIDSIALYSVGDDTYIDYKYV